LIDHTMATRSTPEITARVQIPSDTGRDALPAAFRELHGARLHGFALLLTLGDRPGAAAAVAEALAKGSRSLDQLRHPERAAAWLRRDVVRTVRRRARLRPGRRTADRGSALDALGVTRAAFEGLASLEADARAALVAGTIEGLDPLDVATIVGRDAPATARLIAEARRQYLDAAAGAIARSPEPIAADGPLGTRIRQAGAMTMTHRTTNR
jgi:DNA-directed RNA polymerase specialized sigma24 family protein